MPPPHTQTVREAADPPNSLRNGDFREGRDGGLAVRREFCKWLDIMGPFAAELKFCTDKARQLNI